MIAVEASPGDAAVGKAQGRMRASVMPVLADPDALGALTELMLKRSGLTMNELARRVGRTPQSLRQYRDQRRGKGMTVASLVRWASACGCQVVVECPE